MVVVALLIIAGAVEAGWALLQVFGLLPSHHALYPMTGSFGNPGPLSGLLAMVFPVVSDAALRLRRSGLCEWWRRLVYYIVLSALFLMVCVLPAGLSRTAWIAALVPGVCILGCHYRWRRHWRRFCKENHLIRSWCRRFLLVGAAILASVALAGAYRIKQDSADGRFFMWRMACRAIVGQPWTGYGTGSFPVAYAEAQEAYFAQGNYAVWEERVAGTPACGFNEYLQTGVEHGWWAACLMLAVAVFAVVYAAKAGRTGVAGGMAAFAIFAFASYPLREPETAVAATLLTAASLWPVRGRWHAAVWLVWCGGVFFCCRCCGLAWDDRTNDRGHSEAWQTAHLFYVMKAYRQACEAYGGLPERCFRQAECLFEYGHALHGAGDYEASNRVLAKAAKRCGDPMIWNVMGKNYQQMGQYVDAERCFLRAMHRLPGRIYPYYLLAKLYAEPEYYDRQRGAEMKRIVLTKNPKVHTRAVEEMREEVRILF